MDQQSNTKADPATLSDAEWQQRLTPEQFMDACEEAIRELAYLKWEEAGCPSGDGHDFWLDAEREVVAARSDAMSMRP